MGSGEEVETEASGSKGKRGLTDTLIEGMEGRKVLIGKLKKERSLLLLRVSPIIVTVTKKGGVGVGKGITKAAGTRTWVRKGNSGPLLWTTGKTEETGPSGKEREIFGQRGGISTTRSFSK